MRATARSWIVPILLLSFGRSARAQPPLRWGGDAEGGAPFVEADPRDPRQVRGFDVEIAEMLARGLGRTATFVQVAWASLEQSAERGDFDVALSGSRTGRRCARSTR